MLSVSILIDDQTVISPFRINENIKKYRFHHSKIYVMNK